MSDIRQKFWGLQQHPYEPLFLPKNDGGIVFNLPENFYTERYRSIGSNLSNRFGPSSVRQRPATATPTAVISLGDVTDVDTSFADSIPRNGSFSLFNANHRKVAGQLIELFMKQANATTLGDVAAYVRDRINAPLFQYALSVALQHRSDTADVPIPSFFHLFPDQFVDPAVFPRMREEGRAVLVENRMAIDIPLNYTASDLEPEQSLAYFREDIGVNLHHWHWHLVYPGEGPVEIVKKDRRGELFYYMHTQLINRYKIERFSQKLPRIQNLSNWRQPIPEAYYPKIIRSANSRTYPARYTNMRMSDLNRPDDQLFLTIADAEQQIVRIVEAIDQGRVIAANGQTVPIDNFNGIDILGDIFESSAISINRAYYGDSHNSGHVLLSFIHDPQNRYLESYGVMGDVTTAMRDPVFYRLHGYVDDVFRRHKNRFPPYTVADLSNPNVNILAFDTQLDRLNGSVNTLLTFWQRSQVDLGTGLDFGPQGNITATFTHLQHAPFNYRFQIANNGLNKRATIRIFLAAKVDQSGARIAFDEQRYTAIELDTFRVNLRPGINNIIRRSANSSVTIPYERTFRNVSQSNEPGSDAFRFCNCGWPSHMLLPKGTAEGVSYDLFAMVSNYDQDAVTVDFDPTTNCDDSHSYCGLKDRIYPDARHMGFPLDRRAPSDVRSFIDFVAPYQNMRVTTVTIRFTNTVINRV